MLDWFSNIKILEEEIDKFKNMGFLKRLKGFHTENNKDEKGANEDVWNRKNGKRVWLFFSG